MLTAMGGEIVLKSSYAVLAVCTLASLGLAIPDRSKLVTGGPATSVRTSPTTKPSIAPNSNAKHDVPGPDKKPKSGRPVHWGYAHAKGALPTSSGEEELDPDNWQKVFPQCNPSRPNSRQSPVDIDTKTVQRDPSAGPLYTEGYSKEPATEWDAVNNGHAVQFSAQFPVAPQIHGGGLPDEYVFSQFHFHWGGANVRGSEHTIDKRRFPLELHIVHRRIIENDAAAIRDPSGLAVVGILFEVVNEKQLRKDQPHLPHLDILLNTLDQLNEPGASRKLLLHGFSLSDLLPANQTFYRYIGSLTTPPCSEAAVWSVMANPLQVSENYLLKFRKMHLKPSKDQVNVADNLLMDNYRPVQPLAGRKVTVNVIKAVTPSMLRTIKLPIMRPENLTELQTIPEEERMPDILVF